MTQTMSDGVEALWPSMAGFVLVPGDAGYHDARWVWNAEVDRRLE
jgi:hypothetical protein